MQYLAANNCQTSVAALGRPDRDFSRGDLHGLLQDAQGWVVGHAQVTRDLLQDLPDLMVISRRGVGYERIDLDAAREAGMVVTIASGGNDDCMADHAIGLMLSVGRRFREFQMNMLNGKWSVLISSDLYRKTVGIVGFGRIGKALARRLAGFEARILVHTPHPDLAFAGGRNIEYVSMDDLLEQSDYLSLHAPLTPATRFLIDARALGRMKPNAILVNTARGGVVEDAHLLEALRTAQIAGAGLDVFMSESDPAYAGVTADLLALPNVVATPHAGGSSREGLDRANMIAARAVVSVLDGSSPAPECVVADGRRLS